MLTLAYVFFRKIELFLLISPCHVSNLDFTITIPGVQCLFQLLMAVEKQRLCICCSSSFKTALHYSF